MRTSCTLLGFAASVLLVVAPSAGGADRTAVWLPTTTLAGPNSYGAGVALNARGDAIVTWTNGPDLIARFRGAATSDWGMALTVDHNVSGTPVAAIDDHGSAVVAWAAPSGVIFVSTRPLTAAGWTRPLALSGAGSVVDNPQIAVDAAGDVTVGWLEYAGDAYHFYAAYRPAGGAWSTREVVSTPRMYVPELVASEDGFTLLSWFDWSAQGLRAALGYRGTWQPAATIPGGDAAIEFGPHASAVGIGGVAAVGWQTVRHGNGITEAAVLPAGKTEWRAAESLSFEDGQAGAPDIAIDGRGDVTAAWATNVDLEASDRPTSSGIWSRPVAVSTPGPPSVFGLFGGLEGLAVNRAGDTVVLWTSFQSSALLASSREAGATSWGPPVTVSPHYGGLGHGEAAIDDAGDAISAWSLNVSGESGGVVLATLDALAPQLDALRLPRKGHVGRRLTFSTAFRDISKTSIRWSFGDGRSGIGPTVNHSYRRPGHYAVSLVATDAVGRTSEVKRPLTITR